MKITDYFFHASDEINRDHSIILNLIADYDETKPSIVCDSENSFCD